MNEIEVQESLKSRLQKIKQPPFHILLVDDQKIIAAAIGKMLEDDADFELHHCDKAVSAVRMASSLKPTVILQDLVMPDMDGLQLVEYYQRVPATKDIPIIVLSSKETGETKAEAFEAGANDYLVKLPSKIELQARIRYHSRTRIERMELELTLQELERISTTDALTGIANRRVFNERLEQEWRQGLRQTSMLSIVMMDIDFFKLYNDNYGHQAGDDCLARVAQAIRAVVHRPCDLVARYGGEEFVAILPSTSQEGALLVAERMRETVANLALKHEYATDLGCVTISAGLACAVPCVNQSLEHLLRVADDCLYAAKKAGRNRVETKLLAQA